VLLLLLLLCRHAKDFEASIGALAAAAKSGSADTALAAYDKAAAALHEYLVGAELELTPA
jgi:hypothetical protein